MVHLTMINLNLHNFAFILVILLPSCTLACSNDTLCYHGSCINGSCECEVGWKGDLCNFCDGRVLLDDDTGKLLLVYSYFSLLFNYQLQQNVWLGNASFCFSN